ncbi:MAG: tRNA uridine-5-carboxymethylaminomethyl(34) synthesis GTPase MnmE [Clostridia bacterium]|nr:tRNA uridine-5-carboxymethylaminomethyl(34) synthesis GTPase MnmE [Clostridia bacterium]
MAYGSTIAAISTPSGKGGVAIIRVSGDDALRIAASVFFPKNKSSLLDASPRMQIYGDIISRGEYIDDGMATFFRAPFSYTGENTVEISCHGGILVSRAVLEALLVAGAMPAEAGEFTKRAFINGKLSLTEAEAIGNLLDAKSREQMKLSALTSRERLSSHIEKIRTALTELLSSIFARIDYPDEDLGDFTNEESVERLFNIKEAIESLLATYPTGRAISEGIPTVICGKTNVGKSTLYNAILGEDAAIVTDIEGTTRDVLTREVPLGRVMLRLSDTAGVRGYEMADAVEKIGIERTRVAISASELIIAVFDSSRAADAEDRELISLLSQANGAKIAVLNKCDCERRFDSGILGDVFSDVIEICAKSNEVAAVGALKRMVEGLFTDEKITVGEQAVISSARQNAALSRARDFVNAAILAFQSGEYQDAAASEVERALGAIAEIDGRSVSEEVVSDIFSKFCVGK